MIWITIGNHCISKSSNSIAACTPAWKTIVSWPVWWPGLRWSNTDWIFVHESMQIADGGQVSFGPGPESLITAKSCRRPGQPSAKCNHWFVVPLCYLGSERRFGWFSEPVYALVAIVRLVSDAPNNFITWDKEICPLHIQQMTESFLPSVSDGRVYKLFWHYDYRGWWSL